MTATVGRKDLMSKLMVGILSVCCIWVCDETKPSFTVMYRTSVFAIRTNTHTHTLFKLNSICWPWPQ